MKCNAEDAEKTIVQLETPIVIPHDVSVDYMSLQSHLLLFLVYFFFSFFLKTVIFHAGNRYWRLLLGPWSLERATHRIRVWLEALKRRPSNPFVLPGREKRHIVKCLTLNCRAMPDTWWHSVSDVRHRTCGGKVHGRLCVGSTQKDGSFILKRASVTSLTLDEALSHIDIMLNPAEMLFTAWSAQTRRRERTSLQRLFDLLRPRRFLISLL